MKGLRKWAANTAFDAAMPLGFVILFRGGWVPLLVLIIFLIWRVVKKVNQIGKEKEADNETETEKTGEKTESLHV